MQPSAPSMGNIVEKYLRSIDLHNRHKVIVMKINNMVDAAVRKHFLHISIFPFSIVIYLLINASANTIMTHVNRKKVSSDDRNNKTELANCKFNIRNLNTMLMHNVNKSLRTSNQGGAREAG